MPIIDEIPSFYAPDRATWRKWLLENYETSTGVFLLSHLKGTGTPSVKYDESVEEALCFGWIDSQKRRFDVARRFGKS